jgi:DNA-binding NarL/FixJ family response regulator
MWRVVAFTDEPIVEIGLRALLEADAEFDLVCVCRSRADFISAAERLKPHLLLYGLGLDSNLSMAAELRQLSAQAALVVWGRDVPVELAHQAIELGVRGFVCPSAQPETFKECMRAAASGELWMEKSLTMRLLNNRPIRLSRRQTQLVGLLVQGLKNKEIATSLGISEGTVKAYLTTLFEKVGAKDRFELALFGLKNLRHLQGAGDEAPLADDFRFLQGRSSERKPAAPRRTTPNLTPGAGGWAS